MNDNPEMQLTQNLATPFMERMQAAADERGHGNATKGAGLGALLGAMAGSFGGAWWVLLCSAAGGALGYHVGGWVDEEDQEE